MATDKNISNSYIAILIIVVSCVGAVLFVEYFRARAVTKDLGELKEEYRMYVLALKKILKDKTRYGQIEGNGGKKNGIEGPVCLLPLMVEENEMVCSYDPKETFVVVNRSRDYLRMSALDYAKQYHLDAVLCRMLDDTDTWEKQQKHLSQKVVKKVATKIVRVMQRPAPFVVQKHDFLFSWPIAQSKFWLSSRYGLRKNGRKGWRFHTGIDMAALKGTPIKAAASGIVIGSNYHRGYGNMITIAHNRKYKSRYAHLHARYARIGQKVRRGSVIGTVGDTGLVRSSGDDPSHLHFEVYAFGRHINPVSVLI